MKSKFYIRLTRYRVPQCATHAHLHRLASVLEPQCIHEGYLQSDVAIRAPIRIRERFRDGHPMAEDFASEPVVRIEDGYVETTDAIYQVLRVPAPRPTPDDARSPAKTPIRTTVSKREYQLLREGLFGQMEALGPEVCLIAALLKLHAEKFAKVRAGIPDELTREPISVVDLGAEFDTFLDALCYRYSSRELRDQRERAVWIAGHQVWTALSFAVCLEADFLAQQGHLALFTGCQARLGRMLLAWQHFATLLPAGVGQ
jgi:hypothetical protein